MANLATTEFKAHQTSIPGLIFFDVSQVDDSRGFFQEKYQKAKLLEAGMPESFNVVQNSLSYNKQAGVTRGFHAEPWDKYISVVKGKVFGAWVDLRKGNTFGNVETYEINPNTAVFLPKGVANAFQTIEDDTYYLYSVNAHWSADNYEKYCFVNLKEPTFDVKWPISLDAAIINDRDTQHPLLKDVTPMEIS
jgi:dTDP-4-dehydrorhamnose 3,5-epimerase